MDEDIEVWFKKFVEAHRDAFEKAMSGTTVVVPQRIREFNEALDIIKSSVDGENITIDCDMFDIVVTGGGITIKANNFNVINPIMMSRVFDLASNVEICPMTDGRIMVCFGFNGLARRI